MNCKPEDFLFDYCTVYKVFATKLKVGYQNNGMDFIGIKTKLPQI